MACHCVIVKQRIADATEDLVKLPIVVANVVGRCTPVTRGFWLRRVVLASTGVRISRSAWVCGGVYFSGRNVSIGDKSWIGSGTRIISNRAAAVEIGARCDIAPEVLLVVGSHEVGPATRRGGRGRSAPIVIGAGSWVGARAVFVAGASIGSGCVVAAGSVVTSCFPDDVMVGGIPARVIQTLDHDGVSRAPGHT